MMNGYLVCKDASLSLLCGKDGSTEKFLDEVINSYLCLLRITMEVFSTHFIAKIKNDGVESVDRWYQKADIFSMQYLLVPVHDYGLHWALLVVSLKECKMMYYDSQKGNDGLIYCELLKDYLSRQSILRRKEVIDWTTWNIITVMTLIVGFKYRLRK
ncbi:sentrin-specific protease 1-like [Dysidea avara]|uniref:sentrin-specific protease 1-like n=1 Tax=Dysidea avara TaxID=196820 RepID=UPI003317566D